MLTAVLALLPLLATPFAPPACLQDPPKQEAKVVGPKPCTPEVQKLIDASDNAPDLESQLEILKKALVLARDKGDLQGKGLIDLEAAKLLLRHQEGPEMAKLALEGFQEAAEYFKNSGDKFSFALALKGSADAFDELNDLEPSSRDYQQSLAIFQDMKAEKEIAYVLNNWSSVLAKQGNLNKAIKNEQKALELLRKLSLDGIPQVLLQTSGYCFEIGAVQDSVDYAIEARNLLHNPNDTLYSFANFCVLQGLFRLRKFEAAIKEATETDLEARRLRTEIDDVSPADVVSAFSMKTLGSGLCLSGSPELGIIYLKKALHEMNKLRSKVVRLFTNDSIDQWKQFKPIYVDIYDVMVSQGRFPEADRALAMLEGERLDATSRRDPATLDPLELTIKFTETEQKYVDAYEAKVTALVERSNEADKLRRLDKRTPEEEAKLKELEKKEETARGEYFDWLKKATEEFKGYKPNQYEADKLQYDNVLAQTCGQLTGQTGLKTAALTLVAYEDKTLAVLYLGPDSTPAAHLSDVKIEDLNKRVKAVVDGCSSPSGDPQTESAKLLKDLLGPLLQAAKDAKVQVLMTLLDGPVRWLPWQAMWDADSGKWLGEEFMLPRVTLTSRFNVLSPSSPDWSITAFGNDLSPDGKSRDIPAALDETLAIQGEKGLKAKALNGKEGFTLGSFKAALADKAANVLHVASHFHLEPGSDKDSYLLLGDGTKFSVKDMKSTASVGYGNCELMVLSACQTAVSTGDGATIEGLAASTETKGPKAVMASLWKVNDTATKKLMVRFYDLRAQHKDWTKLQCLAAAEKELREGTLGKPGDSGWRGAESSAKPSADQWKGPGLHPYYWAPFVLFGNWK